MGTATRDIDRATLTRLLADKVAEISVQPEYRWADGRTNFAVDTDGAPAVRVGVLNCGLDCDLWKGLRNPAMIGLYPVGLPQIWGFYANNRKRRTDESGRATIFQTAEPYETACKRFGRVVLLSAMLPLNGDVARRYTKTIHHDAFAPWEGYAKAWSELNALLDAGINRLAYDLVADDRAVIVMNEKNTARISEMTVPATEQGASHGVCKGGNYPQRSAAVLTGLGQFGISRSVFRDEPHEGGARRLLGPLRSLLLFDSAQPLQGRNDEVVFLDDRWRESLKKINDFTVTDPDVNAARYCTYLPADGERGCARCVAFCPSGALASSSPAPDGQYPTNVAAQTHRFWDDVLQFDNGKCCDERGQLAQLYDEWMCGRCVSMCAAEGNIRSGSAEAFAAVVGDGGL